MIIPNFYGWMALAAAASAGTSAALIGALSAKTVVELPPEDRQYKDRPPLAFSCLWIPIRVLAAALLPLIPAAWHQGLERRLMHAGLHYAVTPSQFLAGATLQSVLLAGLIAFAAASWRLNAALWFAGTLICAAVLPYLWLTDRIKRRRRDIHTALPYVLDLITLCVEAGLTLQSAMAHAVAKSPPGPLRDELERVLRDRRAGKTRVAALRDMSVRASEPAVASLVAALVQSESLGIDLGPVLRAQAEQRRTERFSRAEKLAMEAPVKMLLPLIAFIFPCTFIVLGFPIAIKFLRMGL